ncbi:GFA family protein [Minwuia sp.]|uniref:GFA family protein n=1 Tax=Minwuia sp. TaxID=2493630 RepID=UPI003A94303B
MFGETKRGHCLCGAVKFEITVSTPHFHACHCGMCRRWAGGPWMAVQCEGAPTYTAGADAVGWYQGSKWAERGFCTKCGSSLFFRMASDPDLLTAVAVEAFDDASEMELHQHIYIDAKPDRYDFADSVPRLTGEQFMAQISGK